jgi:cysteine synthase A
VTAGPRAPVRPGALGATGDTPVVSAQRVARRLGPSARVATVLVDSGLKYLGGEVYR